MSAPTPSPEFPPGGPFRAALLGIVLSVLFCLVNLSLGLESGLTVSAAIPASVLSWGVLRVLRQPKLHENNLVQAAASSGEAVAAGACFILPALILLGLRVNFSYWETTLLVLAGGVLGVVVMAPLRDVFVAQPDDVSPPAPRNNPEARACSVVLKMLAEEGSGNSGRWLAGGILGGTILKALVSPLRILPAKIEACGRALGAWWYGSVVLSPMLAAVGFIIGFELALLVFLGGVISWGMALPFLAWQTNWAPAANVEPCAALQHEVWRGQVYYLGVGVLLIGGVQFLFLVRGMLATALALSWRTANGLLAGGLVFAAVWVLLGNLGQAAVLTVVAAILVGLTVPMSAYIVGLFGSTSNPISAKTLLAILLTAAVLAGVGWGGNFGKLATVGVAAVVCCAASCGGDACQSFQIGGLIQAEPSRILAMKLLGIAAAAAVVAPVLNLIEAIQGIAAPAAGATEAVAAPQAHMFGDLVMLIFGGGGAPWSTVGVGAAIGLAAMALDFFVLGPRAYRFRLRLMPLGVGMVLPWGVTTMILLGGILERSSRRGRAKGAELQRGTLLASGVIAGESLLALAVGLGTLCGWW